MTFRLSSLAGACLVPLTLLSATPAAAQPRFDEGRPPPDVDVELQLEPYEIGGRTAQEILAQLRALAPTTGWTYNALEYLYDFEIERLTSALTGIPSTRCRLVDFRFDFDFTLVFPEWDRPDDASPELVAAWEAFNEQVVAAWDARRDDAYARAREVFIAVRDREDDCDNYYGRLHPFVLEVFDRDPRARPQADNPRPTMSWPPPGHEWLLAGPVALPKLPGSTEPPATAAATVRRGAAPPRDDRPGLPAPLVPRLSEVTRAIRYDLDGVGVPDPTSGFVVGLVHEGEVQLLDAFGTPGTADADSMTIEHVFAFPAFTEVLVSTLAVALGERGLLDLDAPISRLLDGLSPRLGSATLRQLVSHRAGLDNAPPRDTTAAWDTVLDGLNDRAMVTDPGTLYSYSRYSYGLAVRALEARIGMSVEEGIRQTILVPLGLESTSFGARDADDAQEGLPVAYTSVPDLLVFWLWWVSGDIPGGGPEALATAPTDGPPGSGRSFFRGAWVDRLEPAERLSLLCGVNGETAGFHVLPRSQSILAVASAGRLPIYTTTFLLSRVGEAIEAEPEIFGPRPLDAGAVPRRSPRRCEYQPLTSPNRIEDLRIPAAVGDWLGPYRNGEYQFVLESRDGALVGLRGDLDPYVIYAFEGDTYFAIVEGPDGPAGFPIELFRDARGRRYLRAGERTYLHEADR